MRASPRISVDPGIAGNGPLKDHRTIIFFWRWLPFSLTVADVHGLDNGSEAGLGHLPATAGDCFPWRPTNIGKSEPAIF